MLVMSDKTDRHKTKPFSLRLDKQLRKQLEKLAKHEAIAITTEIVIAIRELLERKGFWPPKPDDKK